MTGKLRVLLVNPGDVLRPEIKYLASSLPEGTIDLQVLLTDECDEMTAISRPINYSFYPAMYVPRLRYPVPLYRFIRKLRRSVNQVDIVHIIDYDYLPCALAALTAYNSDVPLVVTTDALPGVSWSYGSTIVDAVAWVYTQTVGRGIFTLADRVVCLGDYLKTDLGEFVDNSKIDVIPNGIDTEYFDYENRVNTTERTDLLYVGRLDPVKNVTGIVDALAILEERAPDEYRLTVVGSGSRRTECERLIEKYGLTEKVNFEGWQDDVRTYYRNHDILVLPSLSEGLSNVLLEAQACGLPVVSTDVGGTSEVVAAGKVVRPDDPTALADGIETVKKMNMETASRRAREHIVANYNYEQMGRQYASLYRSLAGTGEEIS